MSNVIMKCPHCEQEYQLGISGTVDGCDPCLNILRNPIDHTIINESKATDPLMQDNLIDWVEESYRQDRLRAAQGKA